MTTAHYFAAADGPLRLGELLEGVLELTFDLSVLSSASFRGPEPPSERISHPWSIVLNPDCDLEWDFKSRQQTGQLDKRITHLLLCDLEDETRIRSRLTGAGLRKRAQSYQEDRDHYLPGSPTEEGSLLDQFYIDFKRLFMVPVDYVYAAAAIGAIQRHGFLKPPWAQHLAHRLTNFLGRVGLPDE